MTLDAHVVADVGTLRLDAELAVADSETVAVIGPNGAGKSTLLRALVGLVGLRAGRVVLDDRVLDAPPRAPVPTEQRRIGVAFQDYLLFPHLDATDNVAFGLRSAGVGRAAARRTAAGWLERLGLSEHLTSRPSVLSGGQAQRVALARALATEPRLLLLDEPLVAVDVAARGELRRVLRQALATVPSSRLLVTHDPLEAASLADRVVVIDGGHIVQEGSVALVTTRPQSPWLAGMLGLNLWSGRSDGAGTVDLGGGAVLRVADAPAGPVLVVAHPSTLCLSRRPPTPAAPPALPATVVGVDLYGDRVRVPVRLAGSVAAVAEVTPAVVADLALDRGGEVWVEVAPAALDVYRP